MSKSQIAEQLGKVPIFAACSRGDLKIIARHAVEVDVPANTVIVEEGEKGDTFYVVLDGAVTVRRKAGRQSKKVSTLGAGGYFGELALLDPAPRNATVVASGPMRVAALHGRAFRALLRDVPAMSEKLLTGLARRLRDADAKALG